MAEAHQMFNAHRKNRKVLAGRGRLSPGERYRFISSTDSEDVGRRNHAEHRDPVVSSGILTAARISGLLLPHARSADLRILPGIPSGS